MKLYDQVWQFKEEHPFLGALVIQPWRWKETFSDHDRRRHVVGRVMETHFPVFLLTLALLARSDGWRVFQRWELYVVPFLVVFCEYVMYEFILEPLLPRWTGPYWERGMRLGRQFKNE